MKADFLRGTNFMNEQLWEARAFAEESGATLWMATGQREPGIMLFPGIAGVLTHYLMAHPETHTIQGVIEGQYRIALPANSTATTIIDAILKELNLARDPGQDKLL